MLSQTSYSDNRKNPEEELRRRADKFFMSKNYDEALPHYSRLLSVNPDDTKFIYRFGVCLLLVGKEKSNAATFLYLASKDSLAPDDVYYFLGRGYLINYNFSKALKAFETFKKNYRKDLTPYNVEAYIRNCENGLQLSDKRKNVIILNSKEMPASGFYQNYSFQGSTGRVTNAPTALLSPRDAQSMKEPLMYITNDRNRIYFPSYGKKGENGRDIFIARRSVNNEWSIPESAGSVINTSSDEDYPFMGNDGNTLYFSSKGHNSIGGYDIFKSEFNEISKSWSPPENLGMPINTTSDDFLFVPDPDGLTAFCSTTEESGKNSVIVRKVKLDDEQKSMVTISGVYVPLDQKVRKDARISVLTSSGQGLIFTTRTDAQTGNYKLTVPVGNNYLILVEGGGYLPHLENFSVPANLPGNGMRQVIKLDKLVNEEKLVLQNYFSTGIEGSIPSQTLSKSFPEKPDTSSLVKISINDQLIYATQPSALAEANSKKMAGEKSVIDTNAVVSDEIKKTPYPTLKINRKDKYDPSLEKSVSASDQYQKEEEAARKQDLKEDEATPEIIFNENISNEEIAKIAYEDAVTMQAEADSLKLVVNRLKEEAALKTELAQKYQKQAESTSLNEDSSAVLLEMAAVLIDEAEDQTDHANKIIELAANRDSEAQAAIVEANEIAFFTQTSEPIASNAKNVTITEKKIPKKESTEKSSIKILQAKSPGDSLNGKLQPEEDRQAVAGNNSLYVDTGKTIAVVDKANVPVTETVSSSKVENLIEDKLNTKVEKPISTNEVTNQEIQKANISIDSLGVTKDKAFALVPERKNTESEKSNTPLKVDGTSKPTTITVTEKVDSVKHKPVYDKEILAQVIPVNTDSSAVAKESQTFSKNETKGTSTENSISSITSPDKSQQKAVQTVTPVISDNRNSKADTNMHVQKVEVNNVLSANSVDKAGNANSEKLKFAGNSEKSVENISKNSTEQDSVIAAIEPAKENENKDLQNTSSLNVQRNSPENKTTTVTIPVDVPTNYTKSVSQEKVSGTNTPDVSSAQPTASNSNFGVQHGEINAEAKTAYLDYKSKIGRSNELSVQSLQLQDEINSMPNSKLRDSLIRQSNEMSLESIREWQLAQQKLKLSRTIEPSIDYKMSASGSSDSNSKADQIAGTESSTQQRTFAVNNTKPPAVTENTGKSLPVTLDAKKEGTVNSTTDSLVTPTQKEVESATKTGDENDESQIDVRHRDYPKYVKLKDEIQAVQVETINIFASALNYNKKADEEKEKGIALLDEAEKETNEKKKSQLRKKAAEFQASSEKNERESKKLFYATQENIGDVKYLNKDLALLRDRLKRQPADEQIASVSKPVETKNVSPEKVEVKSIQRVESKPVAPLENLATVKAETAPKVLVNKPEKTDKLPVVSSGKKEFTDKQTKTNVKASTKDKEEDLNVSFEAVASAKVSEKESDEFIRNVFSINDVSAASGEKKITMDPVLPEGLVFKVQISAFQKPIEGNSFHGLQPLSGESSRPGWIRYCVGLFKTFEPANMVKKEIQKIGYKDAFVVAYYNGKRINLYEAYKLIKGKENLSAYKDQSAKEISMLQSVNIYPDRNASKADDRDEISFYGRKTLPVQPVSGPAAEYSVQVGVYSLPTPPGVISGMKDLRVEQINDRLFRYSSGRFPDYKTADSVRSIIVNEGIKDAFVIVYKNGNYQVAREEKQAAVTKSGLSSTEPSLPLNINPLEKSANLVYKVQIGAYKKKVPFNMIEPFMAISDKGITTQTDERELNIFYTGSFSDFSSAEILRKEVLEKGIKDAFVVALKDGKRVPISEEMKK